MNRLKEFFWLCAGAHRTILENTPSESSKYVGIGATIFFTGVFAALAGGYALYTVFDNYFVAAVFGLIWGLMIFNLDRFIVSSMRKNGDPRQEFITAVPRLILAIIISIVIARPLELKVFDKEINAELSLMQQEAKALEEQTVRGRFEGEQQRLRSEISELKEEIDQKTRKRDALRIIAQQEADGTGGTQQRNAGPIYRIKKADADRVEAELDLLTANNLSMINQKETELQDIQLEAKTAINSIAEARNDGLASRLEALSRLTDKSAAIWVAHWFVMLLFLAVETAPVFVKLISQRGPYDYVLRKEEYGYEAAYYEDLAKVNALIRKRSRHLSQEEVDYLTNRLSLSLEGT